MTEVRRQEGQHQENSQEQRNQQNSQQGIPNSLEGMNFEEQRGSLKNSDYGGAIRNTSSGRNSSDVNQEELKS